MKKVTLTFVVEDDDYYDIELDLVNGDMGHAAEHLNENCIESDYDCKDMED